MAEFVGPTGLIKYKRALRFSHLSEEKKIYNVLSNVRFKVMKCRTIFFISTIDFMVLDWTLGNGPLNMIFFFPNR